MIEKLLIYGDQIETTRNLQSDDFVNWSEENFNYVKYNPRKNIDRFGLSITSLDGDVTGLPDLDSLYEYNSENNTNYKETNFRVKTKVYEHEGLREIIEPWKDDLLRSHIIRLGPGGFFPPHRDNRKISIDTMRLIVPLVNCSSPSVNFLLEDKLLYWNVGTLYFINTFKVHTLFNASLHPSYWIIFNVSANEQTINRILENLRYR